jgi:hypothetical protein
MVKTLEALSRRERKVLALLVPGPDDWRSINPEWTEDDGPIYEGGYEPPRPIDKYFRFEWDGAFGVHVGVGMWFGGRKVCVDNSSDVAAIRTLIGRGLLESDDVDSNEAYWRLSPHARMLLGLEGAPAPTNGAGP